MNIKHSVVITGNPMEIDELCGRLNIQRKPLSQHAESLLSAIEEQNEFEADITLKSHMNAGDFITKLVKKM